MLLMTSAQAEWHMPRISTSAFLIAQPLNRSLWLIEPSAWPMPDHALERDRGWWRLLLQQAVGLQNEHAFRAVAERLSLGSVRRDVDIGNEQPSPGELVLERLRRRRNPTPLK
jgi:hypothetical protein